MAVLPQHLSRVPVGREQLSRELLSEHQRDRILVAATEVFAKRGYQATTVDNIVDAAKIGVGSFYLHFNGKQDCFIAAFDRIVAAGREQISAAVDVDAAWPQQVVSMLRSLLDWISSRHLEARLVLVEVHTAGPEAMEHYEETLEQVVPHLRAGRRLNAAAAELPQSLETATIGGLLWLLQQRLASADFKASDELLAELVEIVAGPYLGDEATAQLLATL